VAVAVGLSSARRLPLLAPVILVSDLVFYAATRWIGLHPPAPIRRPKRRQYGDLSAPRPLGTLGGAVPIAEHKRSAEIRVKGGRMLGDRCGAGQCRIDAARTAPLRSRHAHFHEGTCRVGVLPSCAEAQLLARATTPLRRAKVGAGNLSGAARSAVLQYEHRAGLMRGSLLVALSVWLRADAVVEPSVTSCGIWECCGFHRPLAGTRDIIESLIRRTIPTFGWSAISTGTGAGRSLLDVSTAGRRRGGLGTAPRPPSPSGPPDGGVREASAASGARGPAGRRSARRSRALSQ
jgi:hypothetical protein